MTGRSTPVPSSRFDNTFAKSWSLLAMDVSYDVSFTFEASSMSPEAGLQKERAVVYCTLGLPATFSQIQVPVIVCNCPLFLGPVTGSAKNPWLQFHGLQCSSSPSHGFSYLNLCPSKLAAHPLWRQSTQIPSDAE